MSDALNNTLHKLTQRVVENSRASCGAYLDLITR